MYGIHGRTDLPERHLSHLGGYQGSRPVRLGNQPADQRQLDIYGELVDAVYLYDKWCQPVSSDRWEALAAVVDCLCDSGISRTKESGRLAAAVRTSSTPG
jgi:GH15 family glucan-1,4-alpha-glucosidase